LPKQYWRSVVYVIISEPPETRMVPISIRMHKIESRKTSNRKYLSKTILACRERASQKVTIHKYSEFAKFCDRYRVFDKKVKSHQQQQQQQQQQNKRIKHTTPCRSRDLWHPKRMCYLCTTESTESNDWSQAT